MQTERPHVSNWEHDVNNEDYNDNVGNCDIIMYGSLSESDFVCGH